MTYLVALKFWREILIGLLAFLLLIVLMILNHKNDQLKAAESDCSAKILKLQQDQIAVVQDKQNEINKVSSDYEAEKSKQRVKTETITRELQTIVERPVYLNTCIDDDGLSAINSLIADTSS